MRRTDWPKRKTPDGDPAGAQFGLLFGRRGMTLVELMVCLAIVLLIISAATTAYLKLLTTYKSQGSLAESYMANLTGLEMLRYDIEMAGFGLPASLAPGASYSEAAPANSPAPPYDPTALNDSGNVPNGPRAFVMLNNAGANGSDVLAIKSTAANVNAASKKWSMVTLAPGIGQEPKVESWGTTALDPTMDFTTGDRFIVLDNHGMLQPASGAWGCYTFDGDAPNDGYYADASAVANPSSQNVYYIYGLDDSSGQHRMPFNRVDYYLDKIGSDFPSSCAADTYILYRSTVDQATGQLDKTPLINCVKDFQVAFGLDPNGDPTKPIQWVQDLGAMTAAQIQQQVREVRVFLLYQEGAGDTSPSPGFRFSGILNLGDQQIADSLDPADYPANAFEQLSSAPLPGNPQLSSFQPTGNDLRYRWKIVELAVKPMNLLNLPGGTQR